MSPGTERVCTTYVSQVRRYTTVRSDSTAAPALQRAHAQQAVADRGFHSDTLGAGSVSWGTALDHALE